MMLHSFELNKKAFAPAAISTVLNISSKATFRLVPLLTLSNIAHRYLRVSKEVDALTRSNVGSFKGGNESVLITPLCEIILLNVYRMNIFKIFFPRVRFSSMD